METFVKFVTDYICAVYSRISYAILSTGLANKACARPAATSHTCTGGLINNHSPINALRLSELCARNHKQKVRQDL